jgi:hypothetical protein
MAVIQDGTGTGAEARVNASNQLTVLAETFSKEHRESKDGLAFIAHTGTTADTLTITATGGPILYLKNTSTTKDIVLAGMRMYSSAAATIVKLIRNPTLGTIGNENTFTSVNANFGSNTPATATCYTWDEVGNGMTGLSAGTEAAVYGIGVGSTSFAFDGAFLLPPAQSMYINVLNAAGAEFNLTLNYFFETTGDVNAE